MSHLAVLQSQRTVWAKLSLGTLRRTMFALLFFRNVWPKGIPGAKGLCQAEKLGPPGLAAMRQGAMGLAS